MLVVVLLWHLDDSSVLASANVVHYSDDSVTRHLRSNSDSFVGLETGVLRNAWLVIDSPFLIYAVLTSSPEGVTLLGVFSSPCV